MAALAALPIIGGIFGAAGAAQQSAAAQNSAAFNTQVANQNADVALSQGREQALQADTAMKMQVGQEIAAAGASGNAPGTGSARDIAAMTLRQGEISKNNILFNSEMAARGYQNTSSLSTAAGKTAAAGENAAILTPLFGGAGQAANILSKAGDLGGGDGSNPPNPPDYSSTDTFEKTMSTTLSRIG